MGSRHALAEQNAIQIELGWQTGDPRLLAGMGGVKIDGAGLILDGAGTGIEFFGRGRGGERG